VTVEQGSGQIICTSFGKGRRHDFRVFKESKTRIEEQIEVLVDKGYQGIQKLHGKSKIPHRKPRGRELTTEQKQDNQQLAIRRIRGEHVHRRLKVWRIIGSRYRNRRKRLKLRLNVIAGIHNYELTLPPLPSC
jgi:IS5 family transposase